MISPHPRPVAPRVVAVDPGSTESGVVVYDPVCSEPVVAAFKMGNYELRRCLVAKNCPGLPDDRHVSLTGPHVLAVEMIASYGMPVGREVFETCVWLGRFVEAWGGDFRLVYRRDVKLALCHSARANDATIRRALLDRFGGDKARGTKKQPGPLYGVKADAWSALAVAVTYCDTLAAAGGEAHDGR